MLKSTAKFVIGAVSGNPVTVKKDHDPKFNVMDFFQFPDEVGIQGTFEVRTKRKDFNRCRPHEVVYDVMPVPADSMPKNEKSIVEEYVERFGRKKAPEAISEIEEMVKAIAKAFGIPVEMIQAVECDCVYCAQRNSEKKV